MDRDCFMWEMFLIGLHTGEISLRNIDADTQKLKEVCNRSIKCEELKKVLRYSLRGAGKPVNIQIDFWLYAGDSIYAATQYTNLLDDYFFLAKEMKYGHERAREEMYKRKDISKPESDTNELWSYEISIKNRELTYLHLKVDIADEISFHSLEEAMNHLIVQIQDSAGPDGVLVGESELDLDEIL